MADVLSQKEKSDIRNKVITDTLGTTLESGKTIGNISNNLLDKTKFNAQTIQEGIAKAAEEKTNQKYTNAYNGIYGKAPVFVTTTDGQRVLVSADKAKDAWVSAKSTGTNKAYLNSDGSITALPRATMEFSDGKIILDVPKEVRKSDWFKNLYSDSEDFKALATYYANDPTGESEIEIESVTESGEKVKEKKTINDLLTSYKEGLAQNTELYAKKYMNPRHYMQSLTKGFVNLTDSDIDYMYNFKDLVNKNSHKDSYGVVPIPKSVGAFFKDAEGYNSDTREMSEESFYNWYNINLDHTIAGYNAKDAINAMSYKLQYSLEETFANIARGDYDNMSESEKAEVATEIAKTYSFMKMLEEDNPSVDFWSGVVYFGEAVNKSAASRFLKISRATAEVGQYIVDYGAAAVTAFTPLGPLFSSMVAGSLITQSFAEGGIDQVVKDWGDIMEKSDMSFDKLIGKTQSTIEETTDFLQNGAYANIINDLDRSLAELGNVYSGTAAGVFIGNIIGSLPEAILVNMAGAAIGSAVTAGLTSSLFSGAASSALSLETMTAILESTSMGLQVQALNNTIGFMANVISQGALDTVLADGDKLVALFDGATVEEQQDFVEALTGNITWNTAFELVGVGKTAFMEKTPAGQVMQAKMQQLFNRVGIARDSFSVWKGEKIDSFRLNRAKAKGKEAPASLAENLQARNLKKTIIDQKKEIVNTKVFTNEDGAFAGAQRIKELTDQRVKLETEYDFFRKKGMGFKVEENLYKSGLADLDVSLKRQATEIMRIEGAEMGIYTASKSAPSSYTVDYFNYLYSKRFLENSAEALEKIGKSLSQKDQGILGTITERIKKIESNTSIDYQNAVNRYLNDTMKWYSSFYSYLATEQGGNLIDQETLDGWRSTGQWGEDGTQFMRRLGSKTLDDDNAISLVNEMLNEFKATGSDIVKTKTGLEIEHLKQMSADTQYVSQTYVREFFMQSVARAQIASDFGQAITSMSGVSAYRVGDNLNIAKTKSSISSAKKEMASTVSDTLGKHLDKESQIGQATAYRTSANRGARSYYSNLRTDAKGVINDYVGKIGKRNLKAYTSEMSLEDLSLLSQKFDIPTYAKMKNRAEFDELWNGLTEYQQGVIKKVTGRDNPGVTAYNMAIKNADLSDQLSRAYIYGNDKILNSAFYKDLYKNYKIDKLNAAGKLTTSDTQKISNAQKQIEETTKKITEIDKMSDAEKKAANKAMAEEADKLYKEQVLGFVDGVIENADEALAKNPFFNNLVGEYEKAGINPESAREYAILDYLSSEKGMNKIKDTAKEYYANSKVSNVDLKDTMSTNYSNNFVKDVEKIIDSNKRTLGGKLAETGEAEALNIDAIVKETYEYMKDITGEVENNTIVEVLDKSTGKYNFYKVPDYVGALYNYSPAIVKQGGIVGFLSSGNKLARIGQIILNKGSLVTQGFRDTLNAWLGGGMTLPWTKRLAASKLASVLGEADLQALHKEMSDSAWDALTKRAESMAASSGRSFEDSLKRLIAEREVGIVPENLYSKEEMSRGAQYISSRKEFKRAKAAVYGEEETLANAEYWSKSKKQWYEARDKAVSTVKNIADQLDLHEKRESFLRKSVYRNNMVKGMSQGMSIDQARTYATFYMNNATTNFNRSLAWGNSIAKTIPYFGAAINGAESFWRLAEVDPMGVTSRFIFGLAVPMMGLTYMSLQTDEDREIYRNIPEYDKEEAIAFVSGGQVYTIPIPQELATWIAPFRIFVEKAADGNPKLSWQELAFSSLLSAPTIDLSAIMSIDDKKIYGDVKFPDRISNLASSLISQLAPVYVKTAYIGVTGTDPYTGREYGKEKIYYDEEGNPQLESLAENQFVNELAEALNGWGFPVNAQIMEAVIVSLLGKGTTDIIEDVTQLKNAALESETVSEAMNNIGNRIGKRLTDPVTGTTRTDDDTADIAWWSIVSDLKKKKAELMAPNGVLQDLNSKTNTADSLEKKKEYQGKYLSAVDPYQHEVIEAAKNFQKMYPGKFDRQKFASTISLLNLYSYPGRMESYAAQKAASTLFYESKDAAIETLYEQGFTSPEDTSVFGYIVRQDDGTSAVKYYDPLYVSYVSTNVTYGKKDIVDNIDAAIVYSGIKKKYDNDIKPKIDEFYKKSKHTNAEYKAHNKFLEDWDKEVMNTIIDYVGIDNLGKVLENSSALDILDNYVKVPSDYEKNNKGKYFSASRLNKQRGFAPSYIKYVYNYIKNQKENK